MRLCNALRRNLIQAELEGDDARVARLRRRLAAFEPEVIEEAPGETIVAFASSQAADRAEAYGLAAHAFDFPPSGRAGYTVADVEQAATNIREED